MNTVKKDNGVTLIGLVVTIIIILILAGISIGMLTGRSGVVDGALDAKIQVLYDEEEEIAQYAATEAIQMNKLGILTDKDELKKAVVEKAKEKDANISEDDIKVEEKSDTFEVSFEKGTGKIHEIKKVEPDTTTNIGELQDMYSLGNYMDDSTVKVVIKGNAVIGETLTASIISNDFSLDDFEYTWYIKDRDSSEDPEVCETGKEYTVESGLAGKYIYVGAESINYGKEFVSYEKKIGERK